MYKAIIFDCDGTLLDTKIMINCLYEGYRKFYPERPAKPYEEFICCYFFTNMQTKTYLQISDDDYENFIRTAFGDDDHIMNSTKPFEGIQNVILKLKESGYQLGINTSRIQEHMPSVRMQLTPAVYDVFDIVVTSDLAAHPKPAPDTMILIQEALHCDMSQILYIGDSGNDALCAKAAGCDFGLACWGLVDHKKHDAHYEFATPEEILSIVS